ncbi:MAG TPA: MBL fold metallo-hydrolase [Dermatophilaceae bacterium]|nr:MBL fold metallo-hydrolase [Dermatophilaceae bacterium]
MLLLGFPAAAFGTNCYVLATGRGQECVVVDPGIGVERRLGELLAEHGLRPAAVLLTHGHLDHVYAVTPVCGAAGVAAYIHREDRYRLRDPLALVDGGLLAMLEQQFGQRATWREPDDVVELEESATLPLAGLSFTVRHAPGHTEGSVLFLVDDVPSDLAGSEGLTRSALSGDVLFAGSIGRTDLVGGDGAAMARTLREVVLPLPDDTLVLPGHGPLTSVARERATNPYLQGLRP